MAPRGKPIDDADGNAGAGEGGGGDSDPGGVDHGAGEAVFGGLVAELEDLSAGGVGLEEGVVEDGGEILRGGESVGGEGCCVEVVRSAREGIGDGQRVQKLAPSAKGSGSPGYFLSYRVESWLKEAPPAPDFCAKSSFREGWVWTSLGNVGLTAAKFSR